MLQKGKLSNFVKIIKYSNRLVFVCGAIRRGVVVPSHHIATTLDKQVLITDASYQFPPHISAVPVKKL